MYKVNSVSTLEFDFIGIGSWHIKYIGFLERLDVKKTDKAMT